MRAVWEAIGTKQCIALKSETLENPPRGNETRRYQPGDRVTTNAAWPLSTIPLTATVVEGWEQNGYHRYHIRLDPHPTNRKAFTGANAIQSARQVDLDPVTAPDLFTSNH